MKGTSKFDFSSFVGGYDVFAVSKQRFTKEEAIALALREKDWQDDKCFIAVGNAFVRHRAGVDECGERVVGWWLEYEEHSTSCPVWCFHTVKDPSHDHKWAADYEYIKVGD